MTTTPNEPVDEPTVAPSGDPGPPQTDPETPGGAPDDPTAETPSAGESDVQPGQMPDSANTEVGA